VVADMKLDAKSLAFRDILENMMITFDPTEPYGTRDKRKARIICSDKSGPYPIVSLIEGAAGVEFTHSHDANGKSCTCCDENDLVNIPKKIPRGDIEKAESGFVNVYDTGNTVFAATYGNRDKADNDRSHGASQRIACLPFTKGDGL